MDQFERAEQQLEKDYENGNLSRKEFDYEMRELIRDRRAAADEAAQCAYDDEMGRW